MDSPLPKASDAELANSIRALAMDAVEAAKSGHPGMPMGMAEIAVALWTRHLKHNPANTAWADRDRFVLSNGHGSMLLYALLHLTGYPLPMEELKRFRQLGSKTAGHPEHGHTPGVETTTGPLGQGFANAVGMALAEKLLAARFNKPGLELVDHNTYVFLGDGCMMEGISHEAASLAGTHGLGKLIADVPNGAPLFTTRATLFVRGAGGFGGERGPSTAGRNAPPDSAPDHVVEDVTRTEQAAIYRLSGDRNPLHIDPSFAKMAGYEEPFIHGLCTYGFVGRAIVHALCGGDPSRFLSFEARFADQVYPGDAVITKMWLVDEGQAIVQAETQRGNVVLSQAKAMFAPV